MKKLINLALGILISVSLISCGTSKSEKGEAAAAGALLIGTGMFYTDPIGNLSINEKVVFKDEEFNCYPGKYTLGGYFEVTGTSIVINYNQTFKNCSETDNQTCTFDIEAIFNGRLDYRLNANIGDDNLAVRINGTLDIDLVKPRSKPFDCNIDLKMDSKDSDSLTGTICGWKINEISEDEVCKEIVGITRK